MVYVARRPPHVFRLGRFGGGFVLGRTTFRILTALDESSDDGMIRRLQLEDFHVSAERVIEVDLCGKATMVVQDVACPSCASACGPYSHHLARTGDP
jgi:hypothetical protein